MSESGKAGLRRRLGVVSYLNAKPLIAGLEQDESLELRFEVPAKLASLLESGQVDAALVPVIDLWQPGRRWSVISDACIGCDGETYTVRIFSRVPPEQLRILHVDGESHTSVALARVIWAEAYGRELTVQPFTGADRSQCEGVLLIGDKVVSHRLTEFDIETDLGSAWKSLTGLPFVFAVWATEQDTALGDVDARLSGARDRGVATAQAIAENFGPGMGWPVRLATRYLTSRLKFHLGPRQRQGMERFLELAKKHQLVGVERELVFA